ncbi:hypothetical protein SLNWT_1571 [Streptomyces albus]|uniref:Uncharacterized protein n=1 Tax=Streptomyces albus (strain ATCC 21838 / DSM 41398 / FERM P-419 / JCM 4703 / NBRC 107858) TaxID=1081613 RepID=A0A0B5EV58_STRA4|nr:hypothetical protein SLNWT_1571 [Streptomyces albus]AOU76264.1 hypothetical protein SLNHY_1573 [Streptomyces albus]AYN32051.1 hypothetical protein DUI70_1548 [Streptomyces albus]
MLIAISTYFRLARYRTAQGIPYGTSCGVAGQPPSSAAERLLSSMSRRRAAVSSGPLTLKARGNARRRIAESRQTGAGCTYAPRPGSVPR